MPTLAVREFVSEEAWVSGYITKDMVVDSLLNKAAPTLLGATTTILEAYILHASSAHAEEFTLYVIHTF